MPKRPPRPLFSLPEGEVDLAEFASRIAALTEQLVADHNTAIPVAVDGLKRLRADLVERGADAEAVSAIDRLLSRYQQ